MLFFTETWTAQFSKLSNSDSKLNTRVNDYDGRKALVKNFFMLLDSWKRRLDYHLTAYLVFTLDRLNWNCDLVSCKLRARR
jgi:hypothetical protein